MTLKHRSDYYRPARFVANPPRFEFWTRYFAIIIRAIASVN